MEVLGGKRVMGRRTIACGRVFSGGPTASIGGRGCYVSPWLRRHGGGTLCSNRVIKIQKSTTLCENSARPLDISVQQLWSNKVLLEDGAQWLQEQRIYGLIKQSCGEGGAPGWMWSKEEGRSLRSTSDPVCGL